jgi:hypothetical protein
VTLNYQTEVAELEETRTNSTETLREVDALRTRYRLPAWFLVALGVASAVAGFVILGLKGLSILWTGLLGGGALLLGVGLVLMLTGGRARTEDRAEALRLLSEAQRRLNQLRSARADASVGISELARAMKYRDQVELLREWNEYARLREESAPAMQAQERLAALEAQRKQALDSARALLQPLGAGAPEPAELERVAHCIRRSIAVRQRFSELERGGSWVDEEKCVADAEAAGRKERAVRILLSAGLQYDPSRSWAEHAHELAERVRARVRHELLTKELIPQLERGLLSEHELRELHSQLALIESEKRAEGAPTAAGRSPLEVEAESRRHRESLDQVQKRRTDLRLKYEEISRRYYTDHPDKLIQREKIQQALDRARRFKHAIELAKGTIQSVATETHRRWAEFLNQRVTELLGAFGTRVEQLRFGDDLDFSVKLPGGGQSSRGRADLQLSSGARDQLYLAVRLGISEFLSRGQSPLPLLLDDAFATSDDERARAGMKLLIEAFSPAHQIVVLTCHRSRHEGLAKLDAELYAQRVQWLDTRTATLAG